jgi:hypothetical protein
MKYKWTPILLAVVLLVGACSNPFAPATRTPEDEVKEPAKEATEPEIVMDNLERAFEDRDKELYESLLDERFWFTEPDCAGNISFFNDREAELEIMGSRDNSDGLLDQFRTIEYTFSILQNGRTRELGLNHPIAFENDPDGHPDEDWEVFRGRVEMLLLTTPEDGFRVDQLMTFKLRQGEDGLWRIARWVDDPLDSGNDCNASTPKSVAVTTIGRIKAGF